MPTSIHIYVGPCHADLHRLRTEPRSRQVGFSIAHGIEQTESYPHRKACRKLFRILKRTTSEMFSSDRALFRLEISRVQLSAIYPIDERASTFGSAPIVSCFSDLSEPRNRREKAQVWRFLEELEGQVHNQLYQWAVHHEDQRILGAVLDYLDHMDLFVHFRPRAVDSASVAYGRIPGHRGGREITRVDTIRGAVFRS